MALKGLLSVSNARRCYGVEPYRTVRVAENVLLIVQDTDKSFQRTLRNCCSCLTGGRAGIEPTTRSSLCRLLSAHIPIRVFILSLYRLSYLPHGAGAGFEPATSGLQVHENCRKRLSQDGLLSALTAELSGSCLKSVPCRRCQLCAFRTARVRYFHCTFVFRVSRCITRRFFVGSAGGVYSPGLPQPPTLPVLC